MRLTDKLMSRKRSIIETIIDQFKNISQIEHSRASQPHQFSGQCRLWVDCLLSPALQALSQYTLGFTPCCLTRTDVKKILNLTWRLGFRIHEVQCFYLKVINKALYGQNHCLLPRKNSHNQSQQAKAVLAQKSSNLTEKVRRKAGYFQVNTGKVQSLQMPVILLILYCTCLTLYCK